MKAKPPVPSISVPDVSGASRGDGPSGFFVPFMTYREQIRSPKWIKFAAAFKEKHGWRCKARGVAQGPRSELTVHHIYYVRAMYLWDYPEETLECLCWDCHQKRQLLQAELFLSLSSFMGRCTADDLQGDTFWHLLIPVIRQAVKDKKIAKKKPSSTK